MEMIHTNTRFRNTVQMYAAVLAGGLSSRMGCDKRFLEIDGEPLVARALRLASDAMGGESDRVFLCGKIPGYSSIPDRVAGLGPIGGLVSGIGRVPTEAAGQVPWLLVMPVDMPLLTKQLLERLLSQAPGTKTVGAIAYQGYELPFVIRCDMLARTVLDQMCLEPDASLRSIRALLKKIGLRRMQLPDSGKEEMLNANSPLEWGEMSKGSSL